MWAQLGGAALGAIGGGKKKKSGGGPPKWVAQQMQLGYKNLNDAAKRSAGEAIAPLNADQNRAFNMIRGTLGMGQGTMEEALQKYRTASNGVGEAEISRFMNPFQQQVIDAGVGDLERAQARATMGIKSQAEAAGAFGGDRAVVAEALSNEDFNRQIRDMVSGLRFSGWNSAVDNAFRNNDTLMAGAAGMMDTVGAQRGAAYQDAGALLGVGDTTRAYDQSLLDYPLKMAQMQIDAGAAGMGAQAPQTSGGGISGAMAGAAGGYDLFGKLFG